MFAFSALGKIQIKDFVPIVYFIEVTHATNVMIWFHNNIYIKENIYSTYILKEKVVMTIIDAIKKGLKAAGVNEKYALKVQKLFNIEKEDNLETYIQLFKDNILPDLEDTTAIEKAKKDAVAEYEKANNLKGGKPIETNPKGKKGKKKGEEGEEENEEEDFEGLSPAMVKMFKAQQKQISDLATSVTTLTGNISTSAKQASAKALFDNAKLPEKWLKRIDVNSETSVEDQIKELQEEYAEIRQSSINDEVEAGNYKPHVTTPKDHTEKEWETLMNEESGAAESNGTASLGLE